MDISTKKNSGEMQENDEFAENIHSIVLVDYKGSKVYGPEVQMPSEVKNATGSQDTKNLRFTFSVLPGIKSADAFRSLSPDGRKHYALQLCLQQCPDLCGILRGKGLGDRRVMEQLVAGKAILQQERSGEHSQMSALSQMVLPLEEESEHAMLLKGRFSGSESLMDAVVKERMFILLDTEAVLKIVPVKNTDGCVIRNDEQMERYRAMQSQACTKRYLEMYGQEKGKRVFCYQLAFNGEETGVYMVAARVAIGRWQEYYVSLHPGAAEFIANVASEKRQGVFALVGKYPIYFMDGFEWLLNLEVRNATAWSGTCTVSGSTLIPSSITEPLFLSENLGRSLAAARSRVLPTGSRGPQLKDDYLLLWAPGVVWICPDMGAVAEHCRHCVLQTKRSRGICTDFIQLGADLDSAWKAVYRGEVTLGTFVHCGSAELCKSVQEIGANLVAGELSISEAEAEFWGLSREHNALGLDYFDLHAQPELSHQADIAKGLKAAKEKAVKFHREELSQKALEKSFGIFKEVRNIKINESRARSNTWDNQKIAPDEMTQAYTEALHAKVPDAAEENWQVYGKENLPVPEDLYQQVLKLQAMSSERLSAMAADIVEGDQRRKYVREMCRFIMEQGPIVSPDRRHPVPVLPNINPCLIKRIDF